MKSGGGVLLVAGLQLVVGLTLLGIFEGYKVSAALTRPSCKLLLPREAFLNGYPLA